MSNTPLHPTAAQKEELTNLWRYCFQDSEEFIQWYFQDYYKGEHTYILTEPEQGIIAAAMQCNPYTLKIRGAHIPAAYFVGVCTHPAYRGGGYFRRLFPAALQQLAERDIPIAFLLPINNRLYRPYDFTYTHYREDYTLDMADIGAMLRENTADYRQYHTALLTEPEKHWYLFQEIYQAYTKRFHGYACREESNWRNHFADWRMDHCHFALFSRANEGTAYLVYRQEGNTLEILEMAYKTQGDYGMIWRYLYQHRTQAEKISWSAPIGNTLIEEIPRWQGKCALHPYMMTRILSVEKLLSRLAYPSELTAALSLSITDNIIAENNDIFSLDINQGIAAVRRIAPCPNAPAPCSLTISDLTRLIMGQVTAADLRAEEKLTGCENQIQTLETLFPPTRNFLNENF